MVHCHIGLTTTSTTAKPRLTLPPPPSQTPHIQPIINTNPSQAGAASDRQGYSTPH